MNNLIIFTDGASRGNPGPGGWGAVIALSEGDDGESKVKGQRSKAAFSLGENAVLAKARIQIVELGGAEKNTTNNQMELRAAIEALRHIPHSTFHIQLFTDSSYLINGITKWLPGWKKNGWKTKTKKDVLNRELWEELAELTEGKNIEWKYLGGHVGVAGNERCDEIATEFADSAFGAVRPALESLDPLGEERSPSTKFRASRGAIPKLYNGPLSKYGIDILNFDFNEVKAKEKATLRRRSGQAAYSYVSMVAGQIKTHKTWAECEKRVKGKSGARFKKATSVEEEKEIIENWRHV